MSHTTVIEAFYQLLREKSPYVELQEGVTVTPEKLLRTELDPLIFVATRFQNMCCGYNRSGGSRRNCTAEGRECKLSSKGFAEGACLMHYQPHVDPAYHGPVADLMRYPTSMQWVSDCRLRLLAAPIQFDSPLPALQAVVRYLVHRFGVERVKEVIPSRPVDPNPL